MNAYDDAGNARNPHEFYSNYEADDHKSALSQRLKELIEAENPAHVFEFGCGSGKNLAMLKSSIVKCGLDISLINVINSVSRNRLDFVIHGNESYLGHLQYFDIVFTCSVLDHIKDIDRIIEEFKRMARRAIFLAETNDEPGKYYFPHDYERYGFTKLDFTWTGDDGGVYYIWQLIK